MGGLRSASMWKAEKGLGRHKIKWAQDDITLVFLQRDAQHFTCPQELHREISGAWYHAVDPLVDTDYG